MIQDLELYLTPEAGVACAGDAYGSRPVDQLAEADAAIGEPLHCFVQCKTDVDNLTSLQCDLVADDDGEGTGEVVLATRTLSLAQLNTKAPFYVGTANQGASKRFLNIKFTENGTDDSGSGRVAAWLVKAGDYVPQNAGVTF